MGASKSNVRKSSPDEPTQTHQDSAEFIAEEKTLAEAMEKGESAGATRATRGNMKWQGDRTVDSLVYIKFSHNT